MSHLVYNIVLSNVFLFFVLLISFGVVSYWAVGRHSYTRAYGLGWLIGILLIISTASLVGPQPAPPPDADPIRLNFLQVVSAVFMGLLVSAGSAALSLLWKNHEMRRAIQVISYTALFVLMIFMTFLVGAGVRYMMGIFALTLVIVLLFARVVKDYAIQQPTNEQESVEPAAPMPNRADSSYQQPRRQFRNRVEQIREDMRRDEP